MTMNEKVAVVTLGASPVGVAVARMLADNGAKVALLDRDAVSGREAAAQLGENVMFIPVNVTVPEQVAAAIASIKAAWGHIDICCPIGGLTSVDDTVTDNATHSLEAFRQIIDEQLVGLFDVVRLCAAEMLANTEDEEGQRGAIVLSMSPGYYAGAAGRTAYCAAQGGIECMARVTAADLLKSGVTCTAIRVKTHDAPRQPEHIASAIHYLITNSYNNGQVVTLDAGRDMPAKEKQGGRNE